MWQAEDAKSNEEVAVQNYKESEWENAVWYCSQYETSRGATFLHLRVLYMSSFLDRKKN
jgi:hypothetical protein